MTRRGHPLLASALATLILAVACSGSTTEMEVTAFAANLCTSLTSAQQHVFGLYDAKQGAYQDDRCRIRWTPAPLRPDPCLNLTGAQQRDFGITDAERKEVFREGEACFFYRSREFGDHVVVAFASNVAAGLSFRYAQRASGNWDSWQPTDVDGYPAVAFGPTYEANCNIADPATRRARRQGSRRPQCWPRSKPPTDTSRQMAYGVLL